MLHTRHGWWLEEAGEVTPTRPLEGDANADVVIVGGGYLGMWTAWHLLQLEPELDVLLLETAVCGHGPSGRNGGFCETLWGDAPTLRAQAGDAAALAVCRASEDGGRRDRSMVCRERHRRLVSRGADAPGRDDGVAGG